MTSSTKTKSAACPRKSIEKEKEQIYSPAADSAKSPGESELHPSEDRGEGVDIKVSQEEVAQRIQQLAASYNIPADQFAKDLQKRNGVVEIYDQVASEKTLRVPGEKRPRGRRRSGSAQAGLSSNHCARPNFFSSPR